MSDIFQEVDEEVRRERLKKLWDRYNVYIISAAILIVAAVGGWRAFEYYEAKKSAAAGAALEAAAALSAQGKHAEADAAFAKIAADAPGGYRVLARLRAAAELVQTNRKDAVAAYDAIAADSSFDGNWRDLAAIRAGMLLVDTAPLAEMQSRLAPQAEPGRSYRHTARELLALSAWRNHDFAATRRYIDMSVGDAETPASTRSRIDVLSALIAADGKS